MKFERNQSTKCMASFFMGYYKNIRVVGYTGDVYPAGQLATGDQITARYIGFSRPTAIVGRITGYGR